MPSPGETICAECPPGKGCNAPPTPEPVIHGGPGPDKVQVIHWWSTKWGWCECGNPAAFNNEDEQLCAVCAANAASRGGVITRIDGEVTP